MTVCELDTMRLRGRVRDGASLDRMRTRTLARSVEGGDQVVAGVDQLRSGARVGVDVRHAGAPEAWVEFSAPKVATGSNVIPLPLPAAVEVAREVYREAADFVDWAAPFETLRVLRVDVDNDFEDVSQQDAVLGALARVKAPYNPKTRLFPDAARGGATTLTRGPAARWLATLYSKEGEARHRLRYARAGIERDAAVRDLDEARGRLRYEARLRPDVLGRDLQLVRDLNGERLATVARGYFDRVGYGLEVTGVDRAAARVLATELRYDQKAAILGHLLLQAHGLPPEVHRNTRRKYDRRIRELGIGAAELEELARMESFRLDYDKRRMVAAA